jgi:hypothetical protein
LGHRASLARHGGLQELRKKTGLTSCSRPSVPCTDQEPPSVRTCSAEGHGSLVAGRCLRRHLGPTSGLIACSGGGRSSSILAATTFRSSLSSQHCHCLSGLGKGNCAPSGPPQDCTTQRPPSVPATLARVAPGPWHLGMPQVLEEETGNLEQLGALRVQSHQPSRGPATPCECPKPCFE